MGDLLVWILGLAAITLLWNRTGAKPLDGTETVPPGVTISGRVILVGDSLGVGLKQYLAVDSYVKESTVTTQWVESVRQAVETQPTRLVLVSLGTNDCADETLTICKNFAANSERLREAASPATVVWLVPSWLSYASVIRGKLASINARTLEAPDVQVASDGIHLTSGGYQVWATYIKGKISGL